MYRVMIVYFDSYIFILKVIAGISTLGFKRCRYSGKVFFSMAIRTGI